jgi:putative PEP-CTERM system histidine kinase
MALGLIVGIGKRQRSVTRVMVVASLLTAAWCGVNVVHYATGRDLAILTGVLEQARTGAWLLFLYTILTLPADDRGPQPRDRMLYGGLACLALALLFEVFRPLPEPLLAPVQYALRLTMVVIGFALIENLARNSTEEQRWSIKYLCIGLGGILTYELFFYADALLFLDPNPSLAIARGAIHGLVVPLLIVSILRRDVWSPRIALSQKSAVFSTALIASGLYLLLMAASAFYIRLAGGSWGPVIQTTFLFGCVVVLAVILSSGSVRARLKILVAKHFFKYRYDYREEWIRFMSTVSDSDGTEPLDLRVIKAIATPVESVGGALWLRQAGRFALASTWNMTATSLTEDEVASLTRFVEARAWIVDIAEAAGHGTGYDELQLPETLLLIPDAWIVVPLLHKIEIIGFVMLAKPRAPRHLTWEDFDLLRLLARQSASYLAEQTAAGQLAEARQFERFNRRATFVMHDLKNLVSQLSLVSANIGKHGDKPDFRADMSAVMNDAIAKMKQLMDRLHAEQDGGTESQVSLKALLDELVLAKRTPEMALQFDHNGEDVLVPGDRDRLSAMLTHIIQNAIDATGGQGWVKIALSRQDSAAVVEVTDNGAGMDRAFIDHELFKPFRSTKRGGFGIGAFQSRQYARELGGDVDVISSPGAGTTMRVTLPSGRPAAMSDPGAGAGGNVGSAA